MVETRSIVATSAAVRNRLPGCDWDTVITPLRLWALYATVTGGESARPARSVVQKGTQYTERDIRNHCRGEPAAIRGGHRCRVAGSRAVGRARVRQRRPGRVVVRRHDQLGAGRCRAPGART